MMQPCLKEILETERSYVRYLETLIEVYVQPLREDRVRCGARTLHAAAAPLADDACRRAVDPVTPSSNGASSTPKL